MKKLFFYLTAVLFLGGAMTFTSCKPDEETPTVSTEDQAAYDAADGVHGAQLYDHVLNAKGVTDAKLQDMPNFYRCKVCHGWDLKGRNGWYINKPASETSPEIADVMLVQEVRVNDDIRKIYDHVMNVGGRDPFDGTYTKAMPDYSKLLTADDAWDLVKFIKETAHETDDFYTLTVSGTYPNGTKTVSDIGKGGSATNGKAVYDAKCKVCHGVDGTKLNIYCKGIWLGDMFRNDPHEIQHKSVWGMPFDWGHSEAGCEDAGAMPATGISDQDIRDLMVMGQDESLFPSYGNPTVADQEAYDAADGVHGAQLYDHVLNAKGVEDAKLQDMPNFYRCKVCHGWDLKGRNGWYINKAADATTPEIADVMLVQEVRVNDDIRKIYDHVMNVGGRDPFDGTYTKVMPDFSKLLTADDAWDLVKFIKETAHETDDFYTLTVSGTYPTGTKVVTEIGKGGDAANGKVVYDAKCKVCHGTDGSKLNIYCKGIWLGDMFRNDPHEIQHKSVWGMPFDWGHSQAGCTDAGEMPATGISDQDIRDLMVMGQDATLFPSYAK